MHFVLSLKMRLTALGVNKPLMDYSFCFKLTTVGKKKTIAFYARCQLYAFFCNLAPGIGPAPL